MPIGISEFEALAGQMLTLYEEAQMRMLAKISTRLYKNSKQAQWQNKKYAQMSAVKKDVSKTLVSLKKDRQKMASKFLTTAYGAAADSCYADARRVVNALGISELVSPTATKVTAILLDLNNTLNAADRVILRQANDAYAQIVGRAAAEVATGTVTVREAVKKQVEEFARKGITSFVDKGGRSWQMSTYAEMATLTAIERATLEGYVDTMQMYGYDLAIISSHVGACPICVAWEDVIVSVSGQNHQYPSLSQAEGEGVFHPRCLHYISTYYPNITKGGKNHPDPVKQPSQAYSVRQHQRYYERQIRQWKRRMAVAETPQQEREAYAHVRRCQQRLRTVRNDYNVRNPSDHLPRKYWREGGRQNLSTDAKRLKPVKLD